MNILIGYMTENLTGINIYIRNLLENVDFKKLNITILVRSDNNELKKYLNNHECKSYYIDHNRHFIKVLKEYKEIFSTNNYDICYFNISESFDCLGIISAKKFNVKKIMIHSHSSSVEAKKLINKIIKNILNKICKVFLKGKYFTYLACSNKAAKWMFPKKVYKDKKYEIIKNTIKCNEYKFSSEKRKIIRDKYNIDDNCLVIGHIGSFRKVKNQIFLLHIIERINLKYNVKSKLMLVGSNKNHEIISEIENSKAKKSVIMTGEVKNVADYLNAMDVFVFPSAFEGFGIAGIEAQANGLPCLFSTNVPEESKVTDLVKSLSLDENIDKWIETILSMKKERKENNYYNIVKKLGYDSNNEIKKFQKKYIEGEDKDE